MKAVTDQEAKTQLLDRVGAEIQGQLPRAAVSAIYEVLMLNFVAGHAITQPTSPLDALMNRSTREMFAQGSEAAIISIVELAGSTEEVGSKVVDLLTDGIEARTKAVTEEAAAKLVEALAGAFKQAGRRRPAPDDFELDGLDALVRAGVPMGKLDRAEYDKTPSRWQPVALRYSIPNEHNGVWLIDRGGPVSVTNDAPNVCRVVNKVHRYARIFYRDTDGGWNELKHRDGVFFSYEAAPKRGQRNGGPIVQEP